MPRLVRGEAAFGDDIIKQFAVGHIFHHNKNIRRRVDDFIESDDVRVAALLQYVYLSLHLLSHIELSNSISVQYFDCHVMPSNYIGRICEEK